MRSESNKRNMHSNMKPASHAQNRRIRRIENRNSPAGPQVGTTILGALTPTEIAKKLRRKARRLVIATENIKNIEHSIAKVKSSNTEDPAMRDHMLASLASHLQAANKTLARLS